MIVYVVGPSCAGKSTLVRSLLKDGDVVVDFDAIAGALGAMTPHSAKGHVKDLCFKVRTLVEGVVLEKDLDAWVIRSELKPDEIKALGESGAKFLVVDPGVDVAIERALMDGRPDGTVERIKQWYENPPEIPDDHLYNTGRKSSNVKIKSVILDIKEGTLEEDEGVFVGYASIFNNVDSYGDKVVPGAFTKSLGSFGPNGSGIACYWSHQMDDPMKCIGWTKEAGEDDRGLKVKVKLDLDNPNAAQAYKLAKAGVVRQMSFAYEVVDWEDKGDHIELKELKIFEVSLVQVGANQATELLEVKNLLTNVKSDLGEGDLAKIERAQELLAEVLQSVASEDDTDGTNDSSDQELDEVKGKEAETPKPEELTEAKSRVLSEADIIMCKLLLHS